MLNVRRLALGGCLTLLLMVAVVGVALAHDGWISQNGRGKAGTHTSGFWTDSCDESSDGVRVRAWAGLYGQGSVYALSWTRTAPAETAPTTSSVTGSPSVSTGSA